MNETAARTYTDFVVPPNVVSKVDLSRVVNELERVDNELTAIMVRSKSGVATPANPVLSQQLTDFLVTNRLSLVDSQQRTELIKQMRLLKDKVPVIHMTFAVTADHESLQKLAQWLRTSVHPQAVIAVGLQPALVAGAYIRTPSHIHDLSLRAKLSSGHGLLVKELETLRGNS